MRKNESGFTLIELMIGIAMAGIVGGVIYSAYNIQTKIYSEQDRTAEMQQNIRAGMSYLQREVRTAGYNSKDTTDATCGGTNKPGFHTTTSDSLGFSMDLNMDGKCDGSGENVTYSIYEADNIKKLGRKAPTLNEPVAENIVAIDFVYLLEAGGTKTQKRALTTAADRDSIVAVQVSMLAKSRSDDRNKPTTSTFNLAIPKWGATSVAAKKWEFTDSNRYRVLTTTINCRNMRLL